ncbi:MAG: hypothetical protein WB647_06970 [Roseiarcus sp.]|uniref:hypothetical protein n=1 Tax=Roseiarcus sp. TaxID=1969460 RepID=UPI003C4C3415
MQGATMLGSCVLGLIVGLLGAIALATSLVSIYQALSQKRAATVHMTALLSLPIFYGGGTWARNEFIPDTDVQKGSGLYLLMILLTLIIVNAWLAFD